jgi:hypothetical protein
VNSPSNFSLEGRALVVALAPLHLSLEEKALVLVLALQHLSLEGKALVLVLAPQHLSLEGKAQILALVLRRLSKGKELVLALAFQRLWLGRAIRRFAAHLLAQALVLLSKKTPVLAFVALAAARSCSPALRRLLAAAPAPEQLVPVLRSPAVCPFVLLETPLLPPVIVGLAP